MKKLAIIIFILTTIMIYPKKITLILSGSEAQIEETMKNARIWAKRNGHGIKLYEAIFNSSDYLGTVQQILRAKSSEIDIIQIDIIWPGILKHHLVDLRRYFTDNEINTFFPQLIKANSVNGKLLAIPFYSDMGLLYYRKDLLAKYGFAPPNNWEELMRITRIILQKERNSSLKGYVWQGAKYEGLTCNALEWIDSYNGGTFINQ